jgi:acetyl-CoA carboxylase biotin carboxyl carrier protein
MDLDQIKQILQLVKEHELSELEIEQEGLRIKIRKDAGGLVATSSAQPAASAYIPVASGSDAPAQPTGAGGVVSDVVEEDIELAVVKSPIVGTFYRSPDPAAPSFVEIGSVVKKGQVLCIIEAMKLMNDIESEYDGEIVSIYVENGHAVQYGERLFAIKAK